MKILIEEGYDDKYGARQLRRAMERLIENQISDMILKEEIEKGSTITIKGIKGKISIS